MGFRKGAFFSIPSMLARACTDAIGIMKKKVRKKNATPIISLLTESDMYGMAKFSQYTSRGSGAHSVNHKVGFLDCWVCAQTAAPHRVLNETNAAGIIDFGSFKTFFLSSSIWIIPEWYMTQIRGVIRLVIGKAASLTHLNNGFAFLNRKLQIYILMNN